MKRNIKNILFAALVLIGISCSDYLDPEPFSFTSPENFYLTADDAEIALAGVYNTLTARNIQGFGNLSYFGRNMMEIMNGATDECAIRSNLTDNRPAPWGNASFTSQNPELNQAWFFAYAGISRANFLLDNLPGIPDSDFNGTRKVEIEGEARLLRGFFHMMLSMMHGAIPIYTASVDELKKVRQPVQEVYAQVIEDFEFAYENLQDRGLALSSANKWTAAGFLVKVHTYLASMKQNGLNDFGYTPNSFEWVDVNASYTEAVIISEDLVNNSGYVLIENYDYLFRESTKQAQAEELIFSAEASSDPTINVITMVINCFIPQGNGVTVGGGSGWYRPFAELYNSYNANDFRRDHNVSGNLGSNPNLLDVLQINGVRYYQPNTIPGPNAFNMSIGKYRLKDPTQKSTPPWASGLSIPLLRYADILLLRAEALYFTGDEPEARALLSEVRERSVIAPAVVQDLNTAYFNDDFVEELLAERSRELCFENWRRIDLARFNKYDEKINALDPAVGAHNDVAAIIQQNWRSEKVWFPIPLQQIDLNSNLVQNPGY
ncbi:MAG: RagB/SusD family nutrient uptake outer membrane protein [Cyclobacteriaceae bacterium]